MLNFDTLSRHHQASSVNHANIVQTVKKCYKTKINYRDLRWRFLWFCNINRSCFLLIRASLPSKWTTFARQKGYSW